jgi:archaemetzincin
MKKILFLLFSCLLFINCSFEKKEIIIGIKPLGKINQQYQDSVQIAIERYYGFKTVVYPLQKIPQKFFINVKSPRYRADSIIYYLRRTKPDSISYMMGLTGFDISCTKRNKDNTVKEPAYKYNDWGILGLGFRPGTACVVSSFRVKGVNKNQQIKRLQKVTLHELGHNLGLPHCKDSEKCVMRDAAESVKTVDKVDMALCESCLNKI